MRFVSSTIMSNDTHRNNRSLFKFTKRKDISAKEPCQLNQNLCESDDADIYSRHISRSNTDCKSHLLQSSNFPHYHGQLHEKSARQRSDNTKKQKISLQKKRVVSVERATVPITPQMIRVAVKELQTRRAYISSALIASHLRRCYPIENNPDALKEELNEKLDCAVSVGLIAKCGDDKYCIPTLRQQASFNKTALTAFWDTYYRNDALPTTEQFVNLRIPRVRTYKNSKSTTPKRGYDSRCDKDQ